MRQYTNKLQTAKLIELGFESPSSIASVEPIYGMGGISVAKAYTIGELIEMLPMQIFPDGERYVLEISPNQNSWVVKYIALFCEKIYRSCSKSLVDALYKMILRLKEEGVI